MHGIPAWIRTFFEERRVQDITPAYAEARAARGAAYLDDVDPGWFERVDPETLALGDGHCCVLGQLHGEFRLGLGRTAILQFGSAPRASLSPVSLGFHGVTGVPERWQDLDYVYLTDAWQAEIRCRQEEHSMPLPVSNKRPATVEPVGA